MRAARIARVNEPLQLQELQTPKPKGSQILIKVQSAGVCHSDVHVWEGYYEGIGGQPLKTTDRGVNYPLTPGHEIAGIVVRWATVFAYLGFPTMYLLVDLKTSLLIKLQTARLAFEGQMYLLLRKHN